jgi:t-SNARE complex subunit (syntaxin)
VLDRIDYNLERAEGHIEAGREQLEQADKYQKSASKKYLIILLGLAVLGMILGLIVSGKNKKDSPPSPSPSPSPSPPPP